MQSKEKRMKLVGELKKKVEETKNKEEAKEVIEKAGMELTDDELNNITGGYLPFPSGASGGRVRFCGCDNPEIGARDASSGELTCKNCGGRL